MGGRCFRTHRSHRSHRSDRPHRPCWSDRTHGNSRHNRRWYNIHRPSSCYECRLSVCCGLQLHCSSRCHWPHWPHRTYRADWTGLHRSRTSGPFWSTGADWSCFHCSRTSGANWANWTYRPCFYCPRTTRTYRTHGTCVHCSRTTRTNGANRTHGCNRTYRFARTGWTNRADRPHGADRRTGSGGISNNEPDSVQQRYIQCWKRWFDVQRHRLHMRG